MNIKKKIVVAVNFEGKTNLYYFNKRENALQFIEDVKKIDEKIQTAITINERRN